jgi:hypothetical protein
MAASWPARHRRRRVASRCSGALLARRSRPVAEWWGRRSQRCAGPRGRRGRDHSVETELVALDVLHHLARLVDSIGEQKSHGYRSERDQSRALGLEGGQALLAHEPGADPHVQVQPVLDDLALGDALEEQSRARTGGVDARERGPLTVRRERAIELLPRGEPRRWRGYDVPQNLTLEPSDTLGPGAVEGDLELLDRSALPRLRGHGRPPDQRRREPGTRGPGEPGTVPAGTDTIRNSAAERGRRGAAVQAGGGMVAVARSAAAVARAVRRAASRAARWAAVRSAWLGRGVPSGWVQSRRRDSSQPAGFRLAPRAWAGVSVRGRGVGRRRRGAGPARSGRRRWSRRPRARGGAAGPGRWSLARWSARAGGIDVGSLVGATRRTSRTSTPDSTRVVGDLPVGAGHRRRHCRTACVAGRFRCLLGPLPEPGRRPRRVGRGRGPRRLARTGAAGRATRRRRR